MQIAIHEVRPLYRATVRGTVPVGSVRGDSRASDARGSHSWRRGHRKGLGIERGGPRALESYAGRLA